MVKPRKEWWLLAMGCALALEASASLRVMAYNIRHGQGNDNVVCLDRTASVIAKCNPDLVALQEVDMKITRSGNVEQAVELGRKLSMEQQFGQIMDYRGGEYGQAVLSSYPIRKTITHKLPNPEAGDGEPQIALEVQVEVPNINGKTTTVSFVSIHFDSVSKSNRTVQARAVVDALAARSHPVILAGDFNAKPQGEPMKVFFAAGYKGLDTLGKFTYPAQNPVRKIDYILIRNLPVLHCRFEVVDEPMVSDHRPLFGELIVGKPAKEKRDLVVQFEQGKK